jgi:hypothetical protein
MSKLNGVGSALSALLSVKISWYDAVPIVESAASYSSELNAIRIRDMLEVNTESTTLNIGKISDLPAFEPVFAVVKYE